MEGDASDPAPAPAGTPPDGRARRRLVPLALLSAAVGMVAGLVFALFVDGTAFEHGGAARVYSEVGAVPATPVALVLGAAPVGPFGGTNRVLEHRLDAAAELWKAGKVRTLIVSGDRSAGYDEPAAMRAGLLGRGVPASAIELDPAGLRLREAVLRVRDVLGRKEVVIVAEGEAVGRALFVAHQAGIAAWGFNAPSAGVAYTAASEARRWLTSMLAWLGAF